MKITAQVFENEKRLSLNQFFPDEKEEVFVTLKRLTKSDKLKLGLFGNKVMSSMSLKDKKTKEEVEGVFDAIDFDDKETLEELTSLVGINCDLYFNLGVDEKKHSFWLEKEGDFILNSTTFFQVFKNSDMFFYITGKVREFNNNPF